MKIEGPGQIRSNSVRRSGKSDAGAAGAFARQIGSETTTSSGISSANPLSGVDALLALQEVDNVDDATARASRGKARAMEMLERLDELRDGLLSGNLTRGKILDLAQVVRSGKSQVDDPRLSEILDEIDLRAQVELAKLSMAGVN